MQGTALGRRGASSLGEASSHRSPKSVVNGGLLGAAAARTATGEGKAARGSSGGVSGEAGLSAARPAGSFLSPLGSGLRAGEGDFNTGSALGFSSGEKEKRRVKRNVDSANQTDLWPLSWAHTMARFNRKCSGAVADSTTNPPSSLP